MSASDGNPHNSGASSAGVGARGVTPQASAPKAEREIDAADRLVNPVFDSLGRAAARGGTGALAGQVGKALIQVIGLVLLARALSPSAFGVLAMVVGVVGLTEVLRDLGLTTAVVQSRFVSSRQLSQVFWVNVCLGAVLAAAVILGANVIASFYKLDEVANVLRFVAIVFLLNATAAQFRAVLMRQMNFTKLAAIDVSSQAAALAVAVVLANTGFGYWSLAVQQVLQASLILVAVCWAATWRPHRPSRRFADVLSMIRFGAYYAITQVVVFASNNVSTLILGRMFGPSLLGIYDRAFMIATTPSNQLAQPASNVAVSTLSKVKPKSEEFDRLIRRGLIAVVIPTFAGFALLVPFATSIVSLSLGQDWLAAAPILQILCLGAVFQILGFGTFWIFISTGSARSNFYFTVLTRAAAIPAIVWGATYGPIGAAWAYSICMMVIWPAGLAWVRYFVKAHVGYLLGLGARQLATWSTIAAGTFVYINAEGWNRAYTVAIVGALVLLVLKVQLLQRDWVDLWCVMKALTSRKPAETMNI